MARGPHPAREGQFSLLYHSHFDRDVARETQIKTQCGTRTKIVARPWSVDADSALYVSFISVFGSLFFVCCSTNLQKLFDNENEKCC